MKHALDMARTACHAIEDKKGEDIRIIDISGVSIMADYFVIATANSDSQVSALIDNVDEKMREAGHTLKQQEGRSGSWVLMDYGDVIVHIFDRDGRSFYNLERIWNDGKNIEI